MYVCVFGCTYKFTHACGGQRTTSGIIPQDAIHIGRLSLLPVTCQVGWAGWPLGLKDVLSLPPQHGDFKMHGFWGLNSEPCVYLGSSSLNETQPQMYTLYICK